MRNVQTVHNEHVGEKDCICVREKCMKKRAHSSCWLPSPVRSAPPQTTILQLTFIKERERMITQIKKRKKEMYEDIKSMTC